MQPRTRSESTQRLLLLTPTSKRGVGMGSCVHLSVMVSKKEPCCWNLDLWFPGCCRNQDRHGRDVIPGRRERCRSLCWGIPCWILVHPSPPPQGMSVQLRVRRYLENVSPDTGSAAAMAWCPYWGVSVFLEISRSGFSKAQQRQVRADFRRSRRPACAACAEPFEESGSCSSLQKSWGFEVTAGSGCCTLGCQLHPRVPAAPERVCIPTEGPGLGPRLELHYSYLVN